VISCNYNDNSQHNVNWLSKKEEPRVAYLTTPEQESGAYRVKGEMARRARL
jgi:hypothetical protein